MRIRTKRFSLVLAAIAALAAAAFLGWIFTRQGTLGLAQWHPDWRRNFILIGLSGILPLVIGLLGLRRHKDEAWKPGAFLAVAAISFSVLSLAVSGGLSAYVLSAATSAKAPHAAMKLIDPELGIAASGGVVRLSLSSDPHWGVSTSDAEARRSVLKGVSSASPKKDAFIILGDNVEMGMEDSAWREEAKDISAYLGDVPLRSLLGNHDGLIDGEKHFRDYFFLPSFKTDSGSPFYYSMSAGPARIFVLNLLWGAESFGSAQAAWLEKALAAVPAGTQAIALSHSFVYASGYVDEEGLGYYDNQDLIAKVAPILERHKVALLVSGHDHDMELLRKNGVTYAVIGVMGGILDPEYSYKSPASLWFKAGVHGRLDLDISGEGIKLAFRDKDGAPLKEDFIPASR
jgi:tartrate-resistant acid phosphatase type 5